MHIGSAMFKVYDFARRNPGRSKYEVSRDGVAGDTIKGGYGAVTRANAAGLVFVQQVIAGSVEVYAYAYQDLSMETARALCAYYNRNGLVIPSGLLRRVREPVTAPDDQSTREGGR